MWDRSRNLLHVDDDVQVTRLFGRQLEKHGYHASALNDPARAMDELMQTQHRVVLLDIDMPGVSGIELLKSIKELDGGIQVVMLTGLVSMATMIESLQYGAEACLFKPICEVEQLVETLDTCFEKIDRWWQSLDGVSQRKHQQIDPLQKIL